MAELHVFPRRRRALRGGGFEDALWVLGCCLAGAAVCDYGISLIRDLVARRGHPKVKRLREAQAVR
jgi:hypothetical protein